MPLEIKYEEDSLRSRFFKDHPWELARPRIMLETDGRDGLRADWSQHVFEACKKSRRQLDGEAAVQRWSWLLTKERTDRLLPLQRQISELERRLESLDNVITDARDETAHNAARNEKDMLTATKDQVSRELARLDAEVFERTYDRARKEFYATRRREEMRVRISREEGAHYHSKFGPSMIEVAEVLENDQFKDWQIWSKGQTVEAMQRNAAFAGETMNVDESLSETGDEVGDKVFASAAQSAGGRRILE